MKVGNYTFEDIRLELKYSPWIDDNEFIEFYNEKRDFSLVDITRCYELWYLVDQVYKSGHNHSVLEVGVWRGGTAAIIGKKLSLLKSEAKVILADTFEGVVKASEKDFSYNGGEHSDASMDQVISLMENVYQNIQLIKGVFPDQTAKHIKEDTFGFVHIDVDVYESAKDVFDWVWPKLISGGIVVFDDYGHHTTNGVTQYVNEIKNRLDLLFFHNLNGHAIIVKK